MDTRGASFDFDRFTHSVINTCSFKLLLQKKLSCSSFWQSNLHYEFISSHNYIEKMCCKVIWGHLHGLRVMQNGSQILSPTKKIIIHPFCGALKDFYFCLAIQTCSPL